MIDKDHLIPGLEEQLARLKAKIEATRQTAREKGPEVIDHYADELQRLLDTYDTARYKLTLLRKGSGDAISELREGVEQAIADMKNALGKAKDKF